LSTRERFRAVIVGLGQVGIRFDLETARRIAAGGAWTHFSAYERFPEDFELVGAVDPVEANWEYARERKSGLPCFRSVKELMQAGIAFEIASVCTPDQFHLSTLDHLLPHARALFVEKPICPPEELAAAQELTQRLKAAGRSVRVNYFKRAEPSVVQTLARIGGGQIRQAQCKYSGPFAAVGSHAVDLLQWVAPLEDLQGALRHEHPEGEGWSALFSLAGGGSAALLYTGPRHDLIFELELVTADARYLLSENLQKLEISPRQPSARYQGYSEYLRSGGSFPLPPAERFVDSLKGLLSELRGLEAPSYQSWDCALQTQHWMARIVSPESESV
jgi:Oxidoreductase family, NAD-binding Rossmann fold